MRGLTPQRKRVVREKRFENLIDFPTVKIPTKLAFYVVDILNTRKMTLECLMRDIVITPKTVKEVLGLSMGRRKLERKGQREYNDPFLEEWKDQFKNINKLTIQALADLIIDTKNTDYIFRMNILTLISNTLGSCENNSSLKFTVLRNVFEGDDASDVLHEPNILEYNSSSSIESDDDDDDNSKVGDDNEKSYGTQTDSIKEDHILIATNQKINEEIDPLYDPTFGEYYLQNEHLFVPTQTSAEKKKDQTDDVDWESILKNEEKIIRKRREFPAEQRKKARQQERERKRKRKKEKDQIGSSSQDKPVFGIDNSLLGSQLTFDLGASPTYEKMKILSEKKKKMGLKSKYVNKTVDPAVELTDDEKLLGRSIFSTQEEE
nr:peptidase C48, SUMO/sentrin/Ubl1 [Tanacetum cinerariifolium]